MEDSKETPTLEAETQETPPAAESTEIQSAEEQTQLTHKEGELIRIGGEHADADGIDPLKRSKKFSWKSFGGPGFIFSLVFHGILLVVAVFLVVRHIVDKPVEEPDAFVTGAGGGNNGDNARMNNQRMKPRQSMMQTKSRITSKSSKSAIALPEMPVVAMNASFSGGGMGGEPSSGFGGGGGGGIGKGLGKGIGNGSNFLAGFGSRTKSKTALEGYLFDLKVRANGTTIATIAPGDQGKRKEELHKVFTLMDTKNYGATELKRDYARAPTALYATRVFIVNDKGQALDATKATEAFADPPIDKGGKPPFKAPGWLCYYKGKFSVPEDGEYRFVGMGDDAMIVRVDKKTVLYAFWPGEGHGPAVKYQQGWEPKNFCGQGGTDGTNIPQRGQRQSLYKGSWKTMKKGHNYTIEVAFGEAAGGLGGACLGLQKKGKDDDNNFPMFTLEPLDEVPAWGIGETGRYNVTGNFVAR